MDFPSTAILSDGTTQGWGLNDRYQLGTNDTVTTRTPVPVENQGVAGEPTTLFLGATAIAAGTFHGFAVTSSGRIYEWGIHPGPGNVCQGAFEQSKPQDRSVAQPGRFTLEVPPPPQLLPDIGLPEVVIAYRTVRGDQNAQGEYVKVKFSPSSFKLREGERGLSIVEAASLRNDNPYMFPFVLVSSSPARELEKPALVLGLPNCTAYYRPTAEQQLHWEIECLPSDTIAPLVNLYARAQKVLGSIVPNPAFTDAPVRPL
ncbi:MAG: hypothetical protein ACRD2W_08330 [Acidimicrobiales bacterium]